MIPCDMPIDQARIERRTETVTVVLSPTEKRAILDAARRSEFDTSTWLRSLALCSLTFNPRDAR